MSLFSRQPGGEDFSARRLANSSKDAAPQSTFESDPGPGYALDAPMNQVRVLSASPGGTDYEIRNLWTPLSNPHFFHFS